MGIEFEISKFKQHFWSENQNVQKQQSARQPC